MATLGEVIASAKILFEMAEYYLIADHTDKNKGQQKQLARALSMKSLRNCTPEQLAEIKGLISRIGRDLRNVAQEAR